MVLLTTTKSSLKNNENRRKCKVLTKGTKAELKGTRMALGITILRVLTNKQHSMLYEEQVQNLRWGRYFWPAP